MSRGRVIAPLIASGALVIGLLTACAGPASTSGASSAPTPAASASVSAAGPVTAESLAMPSTLTPDELGAAYIEDRLSVWAMMGATQETSDAYYEAGGDVAVIQDVAAKNIELMAGSVFVDNWREVPELATYVDNLRKINETSLELWIKTSGDPGRNEEPYRRWIEASTTSTTEPNGDGSFVLVTEATGHNNADKNRAAELDPAQLTFLLEPLTYRTTFVDAGGQFRVSMIQIAGR